jgi:hypothetical protein
VLCAPSFAFDPIRAELDKTTAWTGEAITLTVKLFSPGPFSGTAAFDLPDLAQTVFVKTGNPVVGSESVSGESYLTQRHEFKIYTLQAGEIALPAFRVRFTGKETFTSEPQPVEGHTPELRFESKHPPGTDSTALVVSATTMNIEQTWNPLPDDEIEPGDVIIRSITREAQGTTAMLLPPVSTVAAQGVEIYVGKPDVVDQVERGDSSARRTDTIKYQFQQPGRFTLPDLAFQWWDPKREEVLSKSVSGLTIDVATPTGTMAVCFWLVRKPIGRWLDAWAAHYNRPAAVAVRKLRTACTEGDAAAAYSAFTAWLAAQRATYGPDVVEHFLNMEQTSGLREQWRELSSQLYGSQQAATAWRGSRLWEAFTQARGGLPPPALDTQKPALPALNPAVTSPLN